MCEIGRSTEPVYKTLTSSTLRATVVCCRLTATRYLVAGIAAGQMLFAEPLLLLLEQNNIQRVNMTPSTSTQKQEIA